MGSAGYRTAAVRSWDLSSRNRDGVDPERRPDRSERMPSRVCPLCRGLLVALRGGATVIDHACIRCDARCTLRRVPRVRVRDGRITTEWEEHWSQPVEELPLRTPWVA